MKLFFKQKTFLIIALVVALLAAGIISLLFFGAKASGTDVEGIVNSDSSWKTSSEQDSAIKMPVVNVALLLTKSEDGDPAVRITQTAMDVDFPSEDVSEDANSQWKIKLIDNLNKEYSSLNIAPNLPRELEELEEKYYVPYVKGANIAVLYNNNIEISRSQFNIFSTIGDTPPQSVDATVENTSLDGESIEDPNDTETDTGESVNSPSVFLHRIKGRLKQVANTANKMLNKTRVFANNKKIIPTVNAMASDYYPNTPQSQYVVNINAVDETGAWPSGIKVKADYSNSGTFVAGPSQRMINSGSSAVFEYKRTSKANVKFVGTTGSCHGLSSSDSSVNFTVTSDQICQLKFRNAITVAIVSEGYSSKTSFAEDAKAISGAFSKIEPFKAYYKNFKFETYFTNELHSSNEISGGLGCSSDTSDKESKLNDRFTKYLNAHPKIKNHAVKILLTNRVCRSLHYGNSDGKGRIFLSGKLYHKNLDNRLLDVKTTAVHEMGHAFGLEDKYVVDYDNGNYAKNATTGKRAKLDKKAQDTEFYTVLNKKKNQYQEVVNDGNLNNKVYLNGDRIVWGNCYTETLPVGLNNPSQLPDEWTNKGGMGIDDLVQGCYRKNWYSDRGLFPTIMDDGYGSFSVADQKIIKERIKKMLPAPITKYKSVSSITYSGKQKEVSLNNGNTYQVFYVSAKGGVNYLRIWVNGLLTNVNVVDPLTPYKFNASDIEVSDGVTTTKSAVITNVCHLNIGKNEIKIGAYNGNGSYKKVKFNFNFKGPRKDCGSIRKTIIKAPL